MALITISLRGGGPIYLQLKEEVIRLAGEGILQPVSFTEYDEIPDYHICVCTESEKENAAEILWLQEDSFS